MQRVLPYESPASEPQVLLTALAVAPGFYEAGAGSGRVGDGDASVRRVRVCEQSHPRQSRRSYYRPLAHRVMKLRGWEVGIFSLHCSRLDDSQPTTHIHRLASTITPSLSFSISLSSSISPCNDYHYQKNNLKPELSRPLCSRSRPVRLSTDEAGY